MEVSHQPLTKVSFFSSSTVYDGCFSLNGCLYPLVPASQGSRVAFRFALKISKTKRFRPTDLLKPFLFKETVCVLGRHRRENRQDDFMIFFTWLSYLTLFPLIQITKLKMSCEMQLQSAVLYVVENMRPVCVREICLPQLIGNECQPSQDCHLLHTETSSGQF